MPRVKPSSFALGRTGAALRYTTWNHEKRW
jgi:hypothetical protein